MYLPESSLESIACAPKRGESPNRHALFTALYAELHRLARRELRRGDRSLALSPTTLLHEVYLNLHDRVGVQFPDQARFLAYASRAMRGLMIDYSRSRQALKRGAGLQITSFQADEHGQVADPAELQRLGDAIDRLAAVEPRLAQVVDLKFFGGFSFGDIGAMWGMSERTVQRDWEKARLFLGRALADQDDASR